MKRRMFTLIELLVCIAVIMILIAMLMPALTRVKYKSKMTTCMSNLKQVGMTATLYAEDNRKWFPYRKNVFSTSFSVPYYLRYGSSSSLDDTETFRNLGLEEIQCPFTNPNWNASGSRAAGYSYYFGWKTPYGNCQLLKLGKKMEYEGKKFDVIASDILHIRWRNSSYGWNGYIRSSHPDREGILERGSAWFSNDYAGHGKLDMNFAHLDGSVSSVLGVVQGDKRLSRVPYENSTESPNTDNQWLVPVD